MTLEPYIHAAERLLEAYRGIWAESTLKSMARRYRRQARDLARLRADG